MKKFLSMLFAMFSANVMATTFTCPSPLEINPGESLRCEELGGWCSVQGPSPWGDKWPPQEGVRSYASTYYYNAKKPPESIEALQQSLNNMRFTYAQIQGLAGPEGLMLRCEYDGVSVETGHPVHTTMRIAVPYSSGCELSGADAFSCPGIEGAELSNYPPALPVNG
ncbi:hypothetical protein [Aeromonas sp. MdU4]|uniref:hypothetical protein n=1 Tax=Aeromonas sp. MdU4 TaxID=3342819 RepID=UPI0035B732E0